MKRITKFTKPSTEFRKQLKLKIITKPIEKNDYAGFTALDFQSGTAAYNGLQVHKLTVSGKNHNILTFIIEGYFKDVNDAAVKFAERFEPTDYELSDIK